MKEDSKITATKVWSGKEEENEEDKVSAPTQGADKISSKSEESLQRALSSQTICNEDGVENKNNKNMSDMAQLSIDSNKEYIENDKMEKQLPPKSPFFLKQLDLSDDIINFGLQFSKTSAGKTKSKKSIGSPLQRKLRGFSTTSSNRLVILKY